VGGAIDADFGVATMLGIKSATDSRVSTGPVPKPAAKRIAGG
jgi:hypothetical protein